MPDDAHANYLFELALADSQPFGDCDYIWQRVCLHYRCRMEMLGEHSKHMRKLLSALDPALVGPKHRVLGDPVVRATIDSSVSHITLGRKPVPEDDLGTVLKIAAANLGAHAAVPPLAEGSEDNFRICENPCPWIWSEARVTADPLGDLFRRQVRRFNQDLVLTTPDVGTRESIVAGLDLLRVLRPRLARSAMSHVHLIAVVDFPSTEFTSVSIPQIPGTIFLSPSALTNPWRAAEFLLHEAMHVKFIDLLHTHSLLGENYDEGTSPMIRPHWNRRRPGAVNEWSIERCLTVLHVYTCLALFFTAVVDRSVSLEAQYGRLGAVDDPIKQVRRSLDRARYLKEQLEHHEQYLGFAGRLFVRWLGGILSSFDPSPPPEGSHVQLFLDLYEREVVELRRVVAHLRKATLEDDALWGESLREIARRELSTTRTVLSMLAEVPPVSCELQNHDDVLAALEVDKASFRASADAFASVRSSVAKTLRSLTLTAYSGSWPGDKEKAPGDVIRVMVEDSGRHLNSLFKVASD